jgi:hypothetical protein
VRRGLRAPSARSGHLIRKPMFGSRTSPDWVALWPLRDDGPRFRPVSFVDCDSNAQHGRNLRSEHHMDALLDGLTPALYGNVAA